MHHICNKFIKMTATTVQKTYLPHPEFPKPIETETELLNLIQQRGTAHTIQEIQQLIIDSYDVHAAKPPHGHVGRLSRKMLTELSYGTGYRQTTVSVSNTLQSCDLLAVNAAKIRSELLKAQPDQATIKTALTLAQNELQTIQTQLRQNAN